MPDDIDWRKFVLVAGSAGTGKSYAIKKVIQTCVATGVKVLVATPTVFLATEYKDSFQNDIDADTIHASFHYPVSQSEKPTFNWNLSNYDVIVIDELSMISPKIFDHIFNTICELPIRPLVLLAGDNRLLQPIEKIDGVIS